MLRKQLPMLYEVENKGHYHEHWLACSHLDAARRAVWHARELGVTLPHVAVSSMVPPEGQAKGGLVYVLNDTRRYSVSGDHVRRMRPPNETCPPGKERSPWRKKPLRT